MADVAPWSERLVGRHNELELVGAFLDGAAVHGGSLLWSGEPGVGKTALLEAAAEGAVASGVRILRGSGVEFEAEVSFSGLNQVLVPLFGEFRRLPVTLRTALEVALGLGDGPAPDQLVVSNATLALLRQAAEATPMVVIVDDLQWLDRSSGAVLGFVARRLTGSRIGFLAAFRSGTETFFERAGLPERELRPLDDDAAARLVRTRFPTLASRVRQRVLGEAQGNPLALLELPAALSDPRHAARLALPAVVPLGRRVQALYGSWLADLPVPTRQLLLLAVLEGSGDLRILRAVAAAGGGSLDDLGPAERARLVDVQETTGQLAFRHPLIRSAVIELSTNDERRRAHHTLAEWLVDQPERRAWHLAEATVEPDEEVAGLLEEAARRILRRGDAVGAIVALARAADLTPGRSDRSRRLAEAAYVGADVTGELRGASQLLVDAHRVDPDLGGSLQAAVATSYLLLNGDGDIDTAHRILVGAIEAAIDRPETENDALAEALHNLLKICLYGGRPELWVPFYAALDRVKPDPSSVLSLWTKTMADPVRTAAAALDQLDAAIASLDDELDPTRIERVATAALFLDRMTGCREVLWRVVRDGREGGAVTSAISALMVLWLDYFMTGQWTETKRVNDEGLALCDAHGYRLLVRPFRFSQSLLAAVRGDFDQSWALTEEMIAWAAPRGARGVQMHATYARTLAAIGRGDFEEAYQQAATISPPGVLPSHVPYVLWMTMDLVEAAVHTNRHAEATAHATALRDAGIAALSPRLAVLVGASIAMTAPDHLASDEFEAALATPGAERWPFDLARVHLAYGEQLRRARAMTKARLHLTVALDGFQRLGARPWTTRATNELRATGQTRHRPATTESLSLTPQEHEIALLAATGLTNKEIGAQLYLSPRTVSAHLYRVFPKLGITSRASLRDALAHEPPAAAS